MSAAIDALAAFSAELSLDEVPDAATAAAQRLFADFSGNCVGGNIAREARLISELTVSRGGAPEATILSSGARVPAASAAFANGATADAFEYQDGYRYGGHHPSHVLPAVLATAEACEASGADLVAAAIVAYEVANRVSRALHPEATLRGWFPIGAAYGAAAASARLRGLDSGGIRDALGCVPFFAPAVMIDSIFAGPSVKPAFAGQIARAGVEAADHAAAGLTGWHEALDAPRGVIQLFAGAGDRDRMGGLGQEWTILDVHQKAIAGCRHTHGAAEACIGLAGDVDPSAVEEIQVSVYRVAKELVDRRTNVGSATSQCVLSLPYAVAAALLDGQVGPAQFTADRIADPAIHTLAAKVSVDLSEELEFRYPGETVTRIRVELKDGSSRSAEVGRPVGDPRNPMTDATFEAKLAANLQLGLTARAAARVREVLAGLRGLSSVSDLTSCFVQDNGEQSRHDGPTERGPS